MEPFVFSPLKDIVNKYAVLSPTQKVKVVVPDYLKVPAADESSRAHIQVYISQLAVSPDHNLPLIHVELQVLPLYLGVRPFHFEGAEPERTSDRYPTTDGRKGSGEA